MTDASSNQWQEAVEERLAQIEERQQSGEERANRVMDILDNMRAATDNMVDAADDTLEAVQAMQLETRELRDQVSELVELHRKFRRSVL